MTTPASPTAPAAPDAAELDALRARVLSLEAERHRLVTLVEILEELAGTLHFADIAQTVARRLGDAFGLDRCSVFLAEKDGHTVRLVASYEDPGIRNYLVDLGRYPELNKVLDTGQTLQISDPINDPRLQHVRQELEMRRVGSITVVPIGWRGTVIGALFLRTFVGGPPFTSDDIHFCEGVADVTAKALGAAYRFERMQERRGDHPAERQLSREREALVAFLRRLLDRFGEHQGPFADTIANTGGGAELDRLAGVAMTVLQQEAAGK